MVQRDDVAGSIATSVCLLNVHVRTYVRTQTHMYVRMYVRTHARFIATAAAAAAAAASACVNFRLLVISNKTDINRGKCRKVRFSAGF